MMRMNGQKNRRTYKVCYSGFNYSGYYRLRLPTTNSFFILLHTSVTPYYLLPVHCTM
ncbi:hypothetical protein [Phocaeicola sp.]